MKTITDQLFEAAGGLIKKQPEVSDATGKFSMADDGGVECEVGEFLYGLVRVLKPERVLTTGIYTGVSDMYVAQALKDNGFGHSTALEIEETHLRRAEKLWKLTGVSEQVTGILKPSLEFTPEGEVDFMFLDSEPDLRFKEVERYFQYLKPGGFIGIHDLHRHLSQTDSEFGFGWPYGPIPQMMLQWIKEGQLRVVSFPTPRGLTLFYRPAPDDFRWD